MTIKLRKEASNTTAPANVMKKRNRHMIDLSQPRQQEKSVSKAFKIWMGAYALVMLAGFSVAASPAHSEPIDTAPITLQAPQQMTMSPTLSEASSHPTAANANLIILGGIASLFAAGSLMVWNTRRKAR